MTVDVKLGKYMTWFMGVMYTSFGAGLRVHYAYFFLYNVVGEVVV